MRRPISRQDPIHGEFNAPASKPQTQRALVIAALADGLTKIHRPLVARETLIMIDACRSLGAKVSLLKDRLDVRGIGLAVNRNLPATPQVSSRYIWAGGSALVARLFLTIGSALPEDVIIDGKCNLRARPFRPLIGALEHKGVEFRFFDSQDCLPCTVTSTSLPGGHYRLAMDVSSQFATALVIAAPLASSPLNIELAGPKYSLSYIRQTVEMISHFGVAVETGNDLQQILVSNTQGYRARDVEVTGDYTSASYILCAAFVTRGRILLGNLDPNSLQGERAIIDILAELGARFEWTQEPNTLLVDCTDLPGSVDVAFDLSDCPNILPTVAAIAATVHGRVRITGGRLTQNHKSRRIDAIATELGKAGVAVEVLKSEDGFVDGLEVKGKERYEGGVVFFDHEDHRIVMAIMLFSLACSLPCSFSGATDTEDSFPGFMEYLGLS